MRNNWKSYEGHRESLSCNQAINIYFEIRQFDNLNHVHNLKLFTTNYLPCQYLLIRMNLRATNKVRSQFNNHFNHFNTFNPTRFT